MWRRSGRVKGQAVDNPADSYEGEVRLERRIQASPEELFDAWTSVDVLKRWWHAARDWETPAADVDPRVGGRVRITMRNPNDGKEYGGAGAYTIFERPRRLAFTWTWDDDEQRRVQLIEVDFIPQEGGETVIVVTNRGLPTDDVGDYREGWTASLDNLEAALGA
jgi:uncharacterized protein YndB with AHSA1/START domain